VGLVLACALLLAEPVCAAPLTQTQQAPGGTVVRVELNDDTVALSATLTLTLTIEAQEPLEVEPIKLLTTARAWQATPLAGSETTALPSGRVRWQLTYRVEPLQPDPAGVALQLEPVRLRVGGDPAPFTVGFKPLTIAVTTVVAGPALSGLKDIPPPEQLPEPAAFPWGLVGAAAGLLGGLLGLGLLGRRWQRAAAVPPVELSPTAWAQQELARLDSLAETDAARWHTLLAEVLRGYLDRRFGLRAAEQTTPEFLAHLRLTAVLPPAVQDQLQALLQRCDLAKFARTAFSPEECRQSAQLARDFLASTAQASAPLAQTTPTL